MGYLVTLIPPSYGAFELYSSTYPATYFTTVIDILLLTCFSFFLYLLYQCERNEKLITPAPQWHRDALLFPTGDQHSEVAFLAIISIPNFTMLSSRPRNFVKVSPRAS
ncbi:hypothetical protein CPC08DRAFT_324380 [Agrocybe pediades]|nr:hypothetical protein CPC08DRAFT_324380 [Agrocybe pediades]